MKLDRRYTIRREWCGQPDKRWVARFCGEWIGQAGSRDVAIELAAEYEAANWA